MIPTLLTGVLTSALLLSSSFSSATPSAAPTPCVVFTQTLSAGCTVSLPEKELQPKAKEITVSPTPLPTLIPISVAPAQTTSFEEVYKQAGAKYGVPWQVLYGLHMTETGGRDGYIMNHSGSGARGPMQFMPGTFTAYAVDGDGDGKPDIDNAVDAIYTAANYLAKHGSLDNGLRSYGGNTVGTLALARSRGFNP